ncbi:twin-arginine translocase subunit TatC [Candidatus Poribacteria bacterium]
MGDDPKTFIEHLAELRKRIIVSALTTVAGTAIGFIFRDFFFSLLMFPMRLRPSDVIATFFGTISRAAVDSPILKLFQLFFRSRTYHTENIEIFAGGPTEKFMVVFKLSFAVGVLLAAPIVLYQMWAFILPALKHREKRHLLPLFFITLFFFFIGAVFAFLVVAPMAMPVLASILPDIRNQWRLENYFSFVLRMMLAFGVAFELPIVMGFVAKIGIFDAASFKKYRRIAIVLIFIASAGLTPQDPFTMFLMAIPLMGLYELGIRFAMAVGAQNARLLSE